MCGVPIERADDYLNRLIALGHRVAVCEQLEDPAAAKTGRKVCRQARRRSAGHARHDHRGAAAGAGPRASFGSRSRRCVRARDATFTGLLRLICRRGRLRSARRTKRGLAAEIARLEPSEVVASQAVYDEPLFSQIVGASCASRPTPLARDGGDQRGGRTAGSANSMASETLDGFGAFTRAEIAAAALALAYVKRTQLRPGLRSPLQRGARAARVLNRSCDPGKPRAHPNVERSAGRFAPGDDRSERDPRRRAPARRAAGESAD